MSWILNEDAAVRAKLSGLQVSMTAGLVDVPVRWFRPEPESTGDMVYPIILMTRMGISKADDREHRGNTVFYQVEGLPTATPDDLWNYYGPYPIPYNFDYQVSVLTRLQQHQTELMSKLARWDRLPSRYGFIEIGGINVVACMDLIGGPELSAVIDTKGQRLFTANYLIRVCSELSPSDPQRSEKVQLITGTISDLEYHNQLDEFTVTDSVGEF
jgi:hypothetical protein